MPKKETVFPFVARNGRIIKIFASEKCAIKIELPYDNLKFTEADIARALEFGLRKAGYLK